MIRLTTLFQLRKLHSTLLIIRIQLCVCMGTVVAYFKTLSQRCTNPGRQTAVATNFCRMAPNFCRVAPNFCRMAPNFVGWRLIFVGWRLIFVGLQYETFWCL
jgi:hypothetical protein